VNVIKRRGQPTKIIMLQSEYDKIVERAKKIYDAHILGLEVKAKAKSGTMDEYEKTAHRYNRVKGIDYPYVYDIPSVDMLVENKFDERLDDALPYLVFYKEKIIKLPETDEFEELRQELKKTRKYINKLFENLYVIDDEEYQTIINTTKEQWDSMSVEEKTERIEPLLYAYEGEEEEFLKEVNNYKFLELNLKGYIKAKSKREMQNLWRIYWGMEPIEEAKPLKKEDAAEETDETQDATTPTTATKPDATTPNWRSSEDEIEAPAADRCETTEDLDATTPTTATESDATTPNWRGSEEKTEEPAADRRETTPDLDETTPTTATKPDATTPNWRGSEEKTEEPAADRCETTSDLDVTTPTTATKPDATTPNWRGSEEETEEPAADRCETTEETSFRKASVQKIYEILLRAIESNTETVEYNYNQLRAELGLFNIRSPRVANAMSKGKTWDEIEKITSPDDRKYDSTYSFMRRIVTPARNEIEAATGIRFICADVIKSHTRRPLLREKADTVIFTLTNTGSVNVSPKNTNTATGTKTGFDINKVVWHKIKKNGDFTGFCETIKDAGQTIEELEEVLSAKDLIEIYREFRKS